MVVDSALVKTSRKISSIFFLVFNFHFIFAVFASFAHPTTAVSTASRINNASQRIKNISRVLGAVGGREEAGLGGGESGREGRGE